MAGTVGFLQTSAADHVWQRGERNLYAGQMRKFVADWIVTTSSLLFFMLAAVVKAICFTITISSIAPTTIAPSMIEGVVLCLLPVLFTLTLVFVVTSFTLSSKFKRQTGYPDLVHRLPTCPRTRGKFNAGHSSNADLGHASAHHSCTLQPNRPYHQLP